MFDVITFGSNTVDIFIQTKHSEIVRGKNKLMAYPLGTKVLIDECHFTTGGGGTNTAVSFSRLGLKTAYLGKISTDHFGKEVMDLLKKEKISFIGSKGDKPNGFSLILDSKEHNRTILAYKGENNNLKFKDLNMNKLKTKWFYFSSMMDKSLDTQKKLAAFAKNNNIKIAFNPSSYLTCFGCKIIEPILKNTEVLILNYEEASMLVKGDIIKNLHKLGPKIVCITHGSKPTIVSDQNHLYTLYSHKLKPVETTGAGDSFASGFVAGMILYDDVEFALQLALANAESVIKYFGAKNKLLSRREALKIIKKNPARIKKEVFI